MQEATQTLGQAVIIIGIALAVLWGLHLGAYAITTGILKAKKKFGTPDGKNHNVHLPPGGFPVSLVGSRHEFHPIRKRDLGEER